MLVTLLALAACGSQSLPLATEIMLAQPEGASTPTKATAGQTPSHVATLESAAEDPTPAGTQGAPAATQPLPARTPNHTATQESIVGTPDNKPDYWPTDGWRASTPEQEGMRSEVLAEMLAEIEDKEHDIDGVFVVRNGHLVLDAYVAPFDANTRHVIHSCTKSVVSTLIGIAIDKGYIEGVDQPFLELFPGRTVANLDAGKVAMTLRDVLTMASGLECRDSYLYGWDGLEEMAKTDDWVQYILDLPMAEPPGSRFEYCNGGSFLLSAVIQETTGMSAQAFAEQHLFGPLGISDFEWPANPRGINIGWGQLKMRPHDMTKFGYLFLNDGVWEGDQVVPAEWVEASTQKHIDATLYDGYGYQWWVDDAGVYLALGYAGQFIYVVPDKEMVAVFVSDLADRDFFVPWGHLHDYIIPAAESSEPLPPDAEGSAWLKLAVEAFAEP
jgi:CubicO group peptidase (beta-lactamase class C family)